jgi:carboxyl-terminal processing protease
MILRFMKNKVLIPLVIGGSLAAFLSFKYIGEGDSTVDSRKNLVVTTVMKALKDGHFAPREINDSFSKSVYTKLIESMDPDKRFFTKEDIAGLQEYEYKIDDEINQGSITFFDKVNTTFTKGVERADRIQKEILKNPMTFNSNDRIQLNREKLDYPANEAALKANWEQYLKFRVLGRYVDIKKEQEKVKTNKDSAGKAKIMTEVEMEADARKSIQKNQDKLFARLLKMDDNERFTIFVNSITGSEDPHTDFFPPEDKKEFDIQMSGSFVGIGAGLKDEDGKIKITDIKPGTPAWKQGELKAGDEIQKVGQGKAEPEDIQGFDIQDVIKKIRGELGTEVRLTVKRVDGSMKVISIIRGKVDIEETFAKSAIIKSADGPVGYIYLPEFYADFNKADGRRCAQDVAIEIQKLKGAGVTGIILDLRYNGGGSLSDVVDMAGLFIDQGPMVQVKSSDAPPMTLRDSRKGVLYDGPLAIMVNQYSASASEIMAAAMQDYKRAVIVGAPTYGKGTVQKVISLDEFLDPVTRLKMMSEGRDKMASGGKTGVLNGGSLGALKLTVQKFYRINGGSTQLRGVTPDIRFPDPYQLIEQGERKDKAALKWDEIPAAGYSPANALNVPQVAALSEKRIKANPTFSLIEESAKELKAKENDNSYSLNEKTYRAEMDKASATSKKMEELQKKGTPLPMTNPKEDLTRINIDTASKERNATWLKNLQKDIYVNETVNIINDIVKTNMRINMGTGMK